MAYNFDKIADRKNINSMKWNVKDGELPLWVADMDFDTAPEIKEAILERANIGAYGYAETNLDWENAYCFWWKTRYNFEIKKEFQRSKDFIASLECVINST